YCFVFFFFQAEDGIRDLIVTGVQTCALPILPEAHRGDAVAGGGRPPPARTRPCGGRSCPGGPVPERGDRGVSAGQGAPVLFHGRSEERRVGKECRCQWAAE